MTTAGLPLVAAEADLDPVGIIDGDPGPDPASTGDARRPSPASSPGLLTIADLAALPAPRFLINDLLRADGLNVLFGPSGGGKTFLMLDLALCISYGTAWWGMAAEQGPVVYVAAEGAAGLHVRVEAWKAARGIATDSEAFTVWPTAVNLFHGDTADLEGAIAELEVPPRLVIFDTLARCMVGGDENSARDVGLAIDHLDRLRYRFGCATGVVHHTGKSGELERGSSALRGAADTMIALRPDGDCARLVCEKQKDAAEFAPWFLRLVPTADSVSLAPETQGSSLTGSETEILAAVSVAFETQRFSPSKAIDVSEAPKASVYRALKSLSQRGLLAEHQINDRRSEYSVTPAGTATVSASLTESQSSAAAESHGSLSLGSETWDGNRGGK